jgi:hypothetical protein
LWNRKPLRRKHKRVSGREIGAAEGEPAMRRLGNHLLVPLTLNSRRESTKKSTWLISFDLRNEAGGNLEMTSQEPVAGRGRNG